MWICLLVVVIAVAITVMVMLSLRSAQPPMPPYVELLGSSSYPQPFVQTNCSATTFALQADRRTLCRLVDGWLNVPINKKYRYVPLCPAVFLCSLAIRRMVCQDPPRSEWGWMEENDLSFMIPLLALRNGILPTHLAIGFPFLMVDQPLTMFTGRENFGYRKVLGQFEMSPILQVPISGATSVLKTFNPSTKLEPAEVVRINVPSDLPPARSGSFKDAKDVFDAMVKYLPDHGELLASCGVNQAVTLPDFFLGSSMQIAYLKQIRDIVDPSIAAYQGVVESPMEITKFVAGGMLDTGFTVTIANYDSYPLISALGLIPDFGRTGDGVIQTFTPMFGMWSQFDFNLPNGRIIVERGANRAGVL
jgi:hypothetical protein